MAEKVVVLHIGTHKTGTKSLQGMLVENATWFADQGLYSPVTGRLQDGGHHNIAWQLLGDDRFNPANGGLNELVKELDRNNPSRVLMSSEDFESLYGQGTQLARFRSALEELGYEVEVVVVLRDPPDYVASLYEELLKHGLAQSPDEFVDGILTNGGVVFRSWDLRIDYEQLLAGFSDVFGAASIHALRYDETDSIVPVLTTVSAIFGLSITPVAGWTRRNTRLNKPSLLSSGQAKAIEAAFSVPVIDLVHRYPAR